MSEPFFSIDVGRILADIDKVKANLNGQAERAIAATMQAMNEISNDLLVQAQSRINDRSGKLRESGVVEDVALEEGQLVQRFGFNSKYARQRDQGGTILPRKAKMLAIPLDPVLTAAGVCRYSSPREDWGNGNGLFMVKLWGHVFLAQMLGRGKATRIQFRWMLVPRVDQEGSAFLSGVVAEQVPGISQRIAQRVGELMRAPA